MADAALTAGASPGRYLLTGSVGFTTARGLLGEAGRVFAAQDPVEVDLAGVTAIDSGGLALLITWLAHARAAGRVLTYRNAPASLRALARISDVDALLLGAAADPAG